MGSEAATISEEIVENFESLHGAQITIRLDISVDVPSGIPEDIIRVVTENGSVLDFD